MLAGLAARTEGGDGLVEASGEKNTGEQSSKQSLVQPFSISGISGGTLLIIWQECSQDARSLSSLIRMHITMLVRICDVQVDVQGCSAICVQAK